MSNNDQLITKLIDSLMDVGIVSNKVEGAPLSTKDKKLYELLLCCYQNSNLVFYTTHNIHILFDLCYIIVYLLKKHFPQTYQNHSLKFFNIFLHPSKNSELKLINNHIRELLFDEKFFNDYVVRTIKRGPEDVLIDDILELDIINLI